MGNSQPKKESVHVEELTAMNSTGDPEKGEYERRWEYGKTLEDEHPGGSLSKEELLRVGDTKAWNAFRTFLSVLFWICLITMLGVAIYIIVSTPRCPPAEWFHKNNVHQVYPRSFQDSDGDGIGDLLGINSRLDHLVNISTHSLLLNNIFQSDDSGLISGITDFKDIDRNLGTIDDFTKLVDNANAKGIKIILDFIPNHSSDVHPWFLESRNDKENEFSDFYVWADGNKTDPPNNWLNVHGDSAWTYEHLRDQWYYHTYTDKQPDLNFRNEEVREAMQNILTHWLKIGVDGFMVRDVSYLYEAEERLNEPVNFEYDGETEPYNQLIHSKTLNQPENYKLIAEWKKTVRGFNTLGKIRTMSVEPRGSLEATMGYYNDDMENGADTLYNFQLLDHLEEDLTGFNIETLVKEWLIAKNNTGYNDRWYTWVIGDLNNKRVASRYGNQYVNTLNALVFLLPGVPINYYGEEIGMESLDDDNDVLKLELDNQVARNGSMRKREADVSDDDSKGQGNNTVPSTTVSNAGPVQSSTDRDIQVTTTPADDVAPVSSKVTKIPVQAKYVKPVQSNVEANLSPMQWDDSTNGGFSNSSELIVPVHSNYKQINVAAQLGMETSTMALFKQISNLRRWEVSLLAGDISSVLVTEDIYSFIRQYEEWAPYFVSLNVGDETITADYNALDTRLPTEGTLVFTTDTEREGTIVNFKQLTVSAGEAIVVQF
ncbi:salivary alpha-glucosidase-like [Saccoglossus kowalevskii]|uniref:Alpha-glucosidase-like n=1 Tax=Saccoglossus kowalevskii TaxID=10224 RepID=A0ABM0GUT4_SACKO|nr:PREDICTED: alpha-glucosidase-like [Saccoglossus kowalevskii]